MKADSTDLSVFRNRGGKLLIAHGVSDPIFSILDTINWWKDVDRANAGRAAEDTIMIGPCWDISNSKSTRLMRALES